MSMSAMSFHGTVAVHAAIVEGAGYSVMRVKMPTAYGRPDNFSIFFEPELLGKFRLLAEAIEHIFGERTQEK